MSLTFSLNQKLPSEIFSRGSSESKYGDIYKRVLDLPIVGLDVDKWMTIEGLPNKPSLARLQACLNPSVSKNGKEKRPRAYQKGLMAQGARVVTRRLEHKDGTFTLYVKKVSRDE